MKYKYQMSIIKTIIMLLFIIIFYTIIIFSLKNIKLRIFFYLGFMITLFFSKKLERQAMELRGETK